MANVHWAVHLISEPFVYIRRSPWRVGGRKPGIWNLDARGCGLILPYRAYVDAPGSPHSHTAYGLMCYESSHKYCKIAITYL